MVYWMVLSRLTRCNLPISLACGQKFMCRSWQGTAVNRSCQELTTISCILDDNKQKDDSNSGICLWRSPASLCWYGYGYGRSEQDGGSGPIRKADRGNPDLS